MIDLAKLAKQVRYSKEDRPFVCVSKNGELLPEVKRVIGVIASNLVLATGHSTAEEDLMLIREGVRHGRRASPDERREPGKVA